MSSVNLTDFLNSKLNETKNIYIAKQIIQIELYTISFGNTGTARG